MTETNDGRARASSALTGVARVVRQNIPSQWQEGSLRLMRQWVLAPLLSSPTARDLALRAAGDAVGLGRIPQAMATNAEAVRAAREAAAKAGSPLPDASRWPVVLVRLEGLDQQAADKCVYDVHSLQTRIGGFRPVFLMGSLAIEAPAKLGYPVEVALAGADVPRQVIAMTDHFPIWMVLTAQPSGLRAEDEALLEALPSYLRQAVASADGRAPRVAGPRDERAADLGETATQGAPSVGSGSTSSAGFAPEGADTTRGTS